jgi:murein DD-endopeptidase MepM/ murein hydrolase activator NlpD
VRAERAVLGLALAMSPGAWAGGSGAEPAHPPSGAPAHLSGALADLSGALAEEPHAAPPAPARPRGGPGDRPRPGASPGPAPVAPRIQDVLARQLDDEAAAVDRALAAVADKLAAAELTRDHRLRAAVRALHPAPGDDAMIAARRRAAARLLLDRDGGERALLVDEDALLHAARARITGDVARLASFALPGAQPGELAGPLPGALARPAPGAIVRHFGALEHERSRATLSRRGIDIEVADHVPVTAPAAGTVRYAGPIRGLDHGVILDHGGYLTVVAKLSEVALLVGAPIATGDKIGRAARHRVYLEVRIKLGPGGLPIDPEPLLGKPR